MYLLDCISSGEMFYQIATLIIGYCVNTNCLQHRGSNRFYKLTMITITNDVFMNDDVNFMYKLNELFTACILNVLFIVWNLYYM